MKTDPVDAVWKALPSELLSHFLIDGRWQAPRTTETIDIVSPVTEEKVLGLPGGAPEDMDAAISAARKAFDEGPWPRMTYRQRSEVLRRIAGELRALGDLPSRLYTAQVAAPAGFANMMAAPGADSFDYYADLADTLSESEDRPITYGRAIVRSVPSGVAAIVTPWNAPIALFSLSVAAALLAGCTVISKPSPESPLDGLLVGWCAMKAGLPAGVLNIVPAGRETGDFMIRDRRVDKISFTGSTAAGRHVAQVGAGRFARVTLELGGKSAAIFLPDANLDLALENVVPWSMPFTGQICFSLTRLLVPYGRKDEIERAYTDAVRALKIGDPWDESTQMGPVVHAGQFDRIANYLETGQRQGARLLTGGGRPAGFDIGHYIEPTVFTDVSPEMTIAREEIFGPVVSIIPYRDEADAIRIANSTTYGLSGAVFGADQEHAAAVAEKIRSGSVSVNTMNAQVGAPGGGFKESGIGRVGGIEGLRSYQESKTLFFAG